ncbi:MAG TPA: phosphatidylglycerophosphatase A [Candidatus Acidoferrales bacterium]|jgi:phosphatidylglycerophosphatase A|nr:phosphatidylglycerophosphatase A [Candidatus Acidoferrales bacterium]
MSSSARLDAGEGKKPGIALAVATSLGLGYLPKAPGTFGSLAGVALGWAALTLSRLQFAPHIATTGESSGTPAPLWINFAMNDFALIVIVSFVGVWAADRTAKYLRTKDPQIVVIDEVAGQLIAYMALATPRSFAVNWKYLLLGFILFRVFDIWKPFPARQAESLPGGLGIMADDWIAGVYAALILWIVRALGM